MKKKVLALIMAFALVASLTACGNTDDNNSSKDSNSGTASTVEKEEAKDTADTENTDFSSRDDQKKDDKSSASDKSNKENSSSKNDNKTSSSTTSSKQNTSADSSSGSNGESASKTHQHNYNTVVSSTNGDCSHKGKVTKKCSCGATITVDGNYGSHNWKNSFKYVHHEAVTKPVYDYCYQCKKCGAQFKDEQTCGEHCLFDCDSTYTYKEWIDHYETVTPAWTERVSNGKDCTICGHHSN